MPKRAKSGIRYAHENARDLIRHMALEILRSENLNPDDVIEAVGFPHSLQEIRGRKYFDMPVTIVMDYEKATREGRQYLTYDSKYVIIGTASEFKVLDSGNAHVRVYKSDMTTWLQTHDCFPDRFLKWELRTGGRPLYRVGSKHFATSRAAARSPAPGQS